MKLDKIVRELNLESDEDALVSKEPELGNSLRDIRKQNQTKIISNQSRSKQFHCGIVREMAGVK